MAQNKTELSWHLSEDHGWPLNRNPEDLDMSVGMRFCSKCEYQADSTLKDLKYHKKEMHGCTWLEQDDSESDQFACNLCDKTFGVLKSLMSHKKQTHED